jgi:hypothetical protein
MNFHLSRPDKPRDTIQIEDIPTPNLAEQLRLEGIVRTTTFSDRYTTINRNGKLVGGIREKEITLILHPSNREEIEELKTILGKRGTPYQIYKDDTSNQ